MEADRGHRRARRRLGTVFGVGLACLLAAGPAAPLAEGRKAHDFTYEDINPNSPTHGQRLSLSTLYAERGIVLNFLASWCGYCWKELPELESMRKSTATPIVGIAADEYNGPERLVEMVDRSGLSLPILLVPGDDIEAMERAYNHQVLPATYVIDKQGRILRVFEGLAPRDRLMAEIATHPGS